MMAARLLGARLRLGAKAPWLGARTPWPGSREPWHLFGRRGLSTPDRSGPSGGGGPGGGIPGSGGSSSGGGGFKEISDLPDDETTSAFGKVIKFGFVLSLLACVVVYLPAMNLGQTSSAIILAGSREPLFQVSGARRLRGYANQKLMCEEVLKNGAMELLLEQLGSDDRVVREEATTTIEAMCRGACAEGARGRYERAVAAQQ
ncbi:hypothetical protein T492DRAFT_406611 [Pavlovales sp. CCMP2436]|nr:hypothetical protein T492DRAFT_406611 [Pavlovales sp. CCMP2436]